MNKIMYDLQNIILKTNDSMKNAIEVLTKEVLKIVMIFEDQGRLVGMVTDSDIRSAFLRLYSFDTVLDNFKRG